MKTLSPTFLVFCLSLGAVGMTDDVKGDKAMIQGTWKVVFIEESSRKVPPCHLDRTLRGFEELQIRVVITKDRYTVKAKDLIFGSKPYKLDPARKPSWFDLGSVRTPEGEELGPNLGIYELKGDDLKICFGKSGKDRPTSFDSSQDSAIDVLLILKREQP
jgi:uncharacterized protein (TIGR03067 family)